MKRILFTAFAAAALTATGSAADSEPMSGQWKLHSNIQGHESDLDCTLAQNGKELKGSCRAGERELPITGTVNGKTVTFQYKTEYEGQELTVIHSGTLESARLTGTVDVQPMAVSGEFTATK